MRFSLFYNCDILPAKTVADLYADIEAQAVLADTLSFDAIWVAEHHFEFYGRLPTPLLFLARLSALTHNIQLGTAIVEAPHYHPLRLAEDANVLDLLSHGRLRLGIGSGSAKKPDEFARFGSSVEQKAQRTYEITEILRQIFDTGQAHFEGQYYQFENIPVHPRSIRNAQQLIWLAASGQTPELAGQHGFGLLIPRISSYGQHHQITARYRAALPPQVPGNIALLRMIYVAETEQAAREQSRETIRRYAHYECGIEWDGRTHTTEYQEVLRRLNAVVGTPEQVIEHIKLWHKEVAFDELICQVYSAGMQHEHAQQALTLLGQEVIPHFQQKEVSSL